MSSNITATRPSRRRVENAARLIAAAMISRADDLYGVLSEAKENRPLGLFPGHLETLVNLDEAASIATRFKSASVLEAVSSGFFGTSVARDQNGDLCVRIYGTRAALQFVENEVEPKVGLGVSLQFKQSGPIAFAQSISCAGGASISAQSGLETGTLGGWLRTRTDETIGITNNHVGADFNSFWSGDVIVHPGVQDSNTGQPLGHLVGAVPLRVHNPLHPIANRADVSWLRPLQSVQADQSIAGRLPSGEVDLLNLFYSQNQPIVVWMKGKTSGPINGTMAAVRSSLFITHQNRGYLFENQLELAIGAQKGDSGSLVLTNKNEIGGLFFAVKDPGEGFANPWQDVTIETGLSFDYR